MSIDIVTREDLNILKADLAQVVKDEIRQLSGVKDVLKSEDVCKMLSISPGTLQTLRVNGLLPYSKLLGTCYYSRADVLKVLEQHKHIGQGIKKPRTATIQTEKEVGNGN